MMDNEIFNDLEEALSILYNGLDDLNIKITKNQEKQLIRYYEMLVEKNKVMNLTSITEIKEVVVKHFLDSLALVKIISSDYLKKQIKVIDIGTGAGFPGIPLKIVFPEIDVTLLDSLNKRLVFLNEVIEDIGLHNIETVHGRSEDIARDCEHREKYDLCVSRAVANLSSLSELCIPFVKREGFFVSYKAGDSADEISEAGYAIEKLGGKVENIVEFTIPNTNLNRVFVKIKKEKETPKAYPRKAGTPIKLPLRKN